MGFVRRYSGDSTPSLEELKRIGGVVIIDGAADGGIQGVGTGVCALVAEFADMSYAVSVDSAGVVTTNPRAVEVFSALDAESKLGGLDVTLGQWGGAMGNGFIEMLHPFSRIIVVPVNLCSSAGVRYTRELPTCKSATDPTPITTVVPATVVAGREFKSGTYRAKAGSRFVFADTPHYASGVDGAGTSAGSAVTQSFNAAGGDFQNRGAKVGDALVVGVIGGAAGLGSNARTYRVVSVVSDTQLTVEEQSGAAFDWTTATGMPWRLYPSVTADSGGVFYSTQTGAYLKPARALDATIVASTFVLPTTPAAVGTATAWSPLSGLAMMTHSSTGLVYTAAVGAPNVANSSTVDVLYGHSLDALLEDTTPANEVNVVWSGRKYDLIMARLKTHVITASSQGRGRVTVLSPILTTVDPNTAMGDAAPGIGANRDQDVIYAWPGVQRQVDALVNVSVATADGHTTVDGSIDVTSDSFVAAILSKLAPERSIKQKGDPVKTAMLPITAFQRGLTTSFSRQHYEAFRRVHLVAPRKTQKYGWLFEEQLTSSLTPGEEHINRRMFSFFIQDSFAERYADFNDEPMSKKLCDDVVGETHNYCDSLLSPDNKDAARITAYDVDNKWGNTPEMFAAGIFFVSTTIQMTPVLDVIVARARVQEGAITVVVE